MEKVKTPETISSDSNDPSNLISKIYSGNKQKEYISEWNVEYKPAEKKLSKPVLFQ